jgi:polysaccharide biosynthesis/export protein
MKMLVKFVFAVVSAVMLCSAQTGSVIPAVPPPVAKNTNPEPPTPIAAQAQTEVNTPAPPVAEVQNQKEVQNNTAVPAAALGPQVVEPAGKPEATEKANNSAGAAGASKEAPFVFGPLDVILVKVWNNANLSSAYAVGQDGTISMPLVGDIKADGLTARQLKEVITQRLSDCCLRTPEVTVEIGKVNSKRYFVYGEVGRAGEYPLVRATTVMDALSDVGGFREFANTKKIRIQRLGPDGKTAKEFLFNYKDVSRGKNLEQNIQLQNGDRIFVQ